jgi:hypothetical protein
MEPVNVKCYKCKCYRTESSFNKKGRIMKTCIVCRTRDIELRNKNKCIHKKVKSLCKECDGSALCIHNVYKSSCKTCGGSAYCIHNIKKQLCKTCGGSAYCIHNRLKSQCKECGDEIKITIKYMIGNSKHKDKKKNNYDPVNFIDKCFVKNLIEDCEDKCYYCNCEMQYIIKQSNLASIERLNNSLGHIKSNCVISCFKCNISKVGDKMNQ